MMGSKTRPSYPKLSRETELTHASRPSCSASSIIASHLLVGAIELAGGRRRSLEAGDQASTSGLIWRLDSTKKTLSMPRTANNGSISVRNNII